MTCPRHSTCGTVSVFENPWQPLDGLHEYVGECSGWQYADDSSIGRLPKGKRPRLLAMEELMVTANYRVHTYADQLLMQEGLSMCWSRSFGIVFANYGLSDFPRGRKARWPKLKSLRLPLSWAAGIEQFGARKTGSQRLFRPTYQGFTA